MSFRPDSLKYVKKVLFRPGAVGPPAMLAATSVAAGASDCVCLRDKIPRLEMGGLWDKR